MAPLPLIHLMLGNAKGIGKTDSAALLVDYFRQQGKEVCCIEVCSRGTGLSAYRKLQVKKVYQPENFVTGETRELGTIFAFNPVLRVVDCSSEDFEVVCRFIREHRLKEHPGWMVHYPVTPTSLKEAREGLLKLVPAMPFPLILWRNGFPQTELSREKALSALLLAKADVAGQVDLPYDETGLLSFCQQNHLLLNEVENGQFGIVKASAAKILRPLLSQQLDQLLGLDSSIPSWVSEYSS